MICLIKAEYFFHSGQQYPDMENISVWQMTDSGVKSYPRLRENISVNALVIGGGIAGYLTAYKLASTGRKTVLIEGYKLFSGTTGHTTAKITYMHGDVYSKLLKNYGVSVAKRYYEAQRCGMDAIKKLRDEYDIDCDWQVLTGNVYSSESSEVTQKIYCAMSDIGVKVALKRVETPVGSALAVQAPAQYAFHPLKFLRALPVNFDIYENTRAVNIDVSKKTVYTEEGGIHADIIVVATRFPIIQSHGSYFLKVRPSMSYTAAVKGPILDGTYLDAREDGLSIRPYKGGVTVGGFDRRTGTGDDRAFYGLLSAVSRMFGEREIIAEWAAQDCMSFDGIPYVGYYSPELRDIYVITGFNKWGMANSATAAMLISDLADGKENPYEELYSPLRKRRGVAGEFLRNTVRSAAYLITGNLHFPLSTARSIMPGEGKIVRLHGKKRAVYKEPDGRLYATEAMCPHLHAELRWNSETKTWDCPCHGSRFDRYGNILSAPSVRSCKPHAKIEEEKATEAKRTESGNTNVK